MHKFILIPLLSFLLPMTASAAMISLRATPTDIGAGDTVQVTILLDSAIPTNAFSGTLLYPLTLEPVAISDGNSIVSMWITRPVIRAGIPITFAGITPGGFSGNNGVLFSVLFQAKTAGTAKLSLGNIEVLRNDGAGGNEPTATKALILSIGSRPSGGYVEPIDQTPPEPFTALISTNPQLFNGNAHIVFTAVDKGSGVDHYSVTESRLPAFLLSLFPLSWQVATSPYVLTDQHLTSTVYLKAIDRAGNERISVSLPTHFFTAYEKIAFLVILIVVVLLWQKGWGRRRKLHL
jgi:hypothetical protein